MKLIQDDAVIDKSVILVSAWSTMLWMVRISTPNACIPEVQSSDQTAKCARPNQSGINP